MKTCNLHDQKRLLQLASYSFVLYRMQLFRYQKLLAAFHFVANIFLEKLQPTTYKHYNKYCSAPKLIIIVIVVVKYNFSNVNKFFIKSKVQHLIPGNELRLSPPLLLPPHLLLHFLSQHPQASTVPFASVLHLSSSLKLTRTIVFAINCRVVVISYDP